MKLSEVDSSKLNNNIIKKIFFNIKKENYKYADYVVIYGCHIKELLNERLQHALKILKEHDYGKIVLTGGIGVNGDFNESEYMKKFLVANNIDESKIIIENESTTTEENNINIMNMLNLNSIQNFTSIALITHEFHLLRIILQWAKILNNNNIYFYYDFVDNTKLSYDKIINTPELIESIRKQLEKTKQFIKEGQYIDINID
ncbi:MAG: YdcF family protein [Bacilli bacterium]|nr:YdcF family protein [Bacilli bacterium]